MCQNRVMGGLPDIRNFCEGISEIRKLQDLGGGDFCGGFENAPELSSIHYTSVLTIYWLFTQTIRNRSKFQSKMFLQ
jgi:hypothetical protein